jgi:hypothetical protein
VANASPEARSSSGFIWKQPTRLRVETFIVLAAVLAVVGGGAFVAYRNVHPIPKVDHFNHNWWVAHKAWRVEMLPDLLTSKICPGTTYRTVRTMLGKPDAEFEELRGPTFDYDIGGIFGGDFYVSFKPASRGQRLVVYQVSPPILFHWPETGCWT